MRFGRSRVQDRVRNSDVETVIEEPSAEISHDAPERAPERAPEPAPEGASEDASEHASRDESGDATGYEPSHFVDSHTITESEDLAADDLAAQETDTPEVDAHEVDDEDAAAIDALRAATTAADTRMFELSSAQVAEICRLHEVTVDAQRRAGRMLATPSARRRLHDAVTEEYDALHMLGFETFDEFATAYAATPSVDDRPEDSAETIARIAEILAEIGIDPSADPLAAARDFLATHEDEWLEAEDEVAPAAFSPAITWAHPPTADFEPEAVTREETDAEPWETTAPVAFDEPSSPGHEVEVEDEIPSLLEAASAIDMAATRAEAAASPVFEHPPTAPETESWVAAAQMPADTEELQPEPAAAVAARPDIPDRDEEIVDRWISAEARAERMHAEVDRAQSELVALLARSAELESTVVERVNERDTAHADLEQARTRVVELERAIARSDAERTEIDTALATSRERIAELELVAADREQAYVQSEHDRVAALATAAELEANLAERSSELEEARAAVTALEAEIAAQGAELDVARSELGSTREDMLELRTVLESTRRSVDALDQHAEAIETELAEARRKAESPEGRQQLEAVRTELANARNELVELEARRTETETMITRNRDELEQLQRSLMTTRELTATARSELSAARNALEATTANADAAERARAAITIDVADLLARAEAEAANLLERAGRDAEAIRQQALLEHPAAAVENDAITRLADQVERLERKLSKQFRKLDKITHGDGAPAAQTKRERKAGATATLDATAAEILATAEREAMEVRRAAREDRDRFREELVGLLSRLEPPADETDTDDYY